MPAEKNKQIATEWFAAFNEHNLAKLLALYDEKAEHYSPKLKARRPESSGLIRGKQALSQWWQEAFDRIPSLRYEVSKIVADEQTVFMEYFRYVENEETLRVCEVLEIRNGLIVFSKVYHG